MDPLHATIEEFAADGYTHIECFCPWCRNDEVEADQSMVEVARMGGNSSKLFDGPSTPK